MWGPAAVWAAVLFLLSSIPDTGDIPFGVSDRLVHFGLYSVLGVTLAHARVESRGALAHWFLLLLGVAYGASDEWHQSFVHGRGPEMGDWIADVAGVAVGYVFIHRVWRAWRMSGSLGTE